MRGKPIYWFYGDVGSNPIMRSFLEIKKFRVCSLNGKIPMKKFETKRKANKSYSKMRNAPMQLLPAFDVNAYIKAMVRELGKKFKNIK